MLLVANKPIHLTSYPLITVDNNSMEHFQEGHNHRTLPNNDAKKKYK